MTKLGSTGKYPKGKIAEGDQGQIRLSLSIYNNTVFLDFGTHVSWLGFAKEEAIEVGQALIDKANEIGLPYIPFGPEWEREVMKLTKKDIIKIFRNACMENKQLNLEIKMLKDK